MSAKRFKSKVDRWLWLILIAAIVIDVGVIGMIALEGDNPLTLTVTILVSPADKTGFLEAIGHDLSA